jgi:membrane protein
MTAPVVGPASDVKRHWTARLFVQGLWAYYGDGGPRMAAALAYYTAFSLAPLLVIAVALAALFFPRDLAAERIVGTFAEVLGPAAGDAVTAIYAATAQPSSSLGATFAGLAVLLYGASNALAELRNALNVIWRVDSTQTTLQSFARDRLVSFGMVLGIGFLLLVSLIVSTILNAISAWWSARTPWLVSVLAWLNTLVSMGVATVLFGALVKRIPDRDLPWRDVWPGAMVTALLFTGGKAVLAWYLGRAATTSAYGAAGSFVALLVWVYYSSQILLYGAELTRLATEGRASGPGIEGPAHHGSQAD